jgi:hypothetical protein
MATTSRGGDHGNEEAGQEGCEACGQEDREEDREEEDREEVVLPVVASPDVEKGKFVLVGVGAPQVSLPAVPGVPYFIAPKGRYRVARVHLPDGVLEEDVEVVDDWGDEDEMMRLVREVNEDESSVLRVTVKRKLAASLERVVISVDLEQD